MGLCTEVQRPPTYLLVAVDQKLQDVVHGAHIEDEPQLCDTHGDEAEQQDGAEYAVHEGGGGCGEKATGAQGESRPVPPWLTARPPPRDPGCGEGRPIC